MKIFVKISRPVIKATIGGVLASFVRGTTLGQIPFWNPALNKFCLSKIDNLVDKNVIAWNNATQEYENVALDDSLTKRTIPDGGVLSLGTAGKVGFCDMLHGDNEGGVSFTFSSTGGVNVKISTGFAFIVDTPNKMNLYSIAGDVKVQNNTGVTKDVYYTLKGVLL